MKICISDLSALFWLCINIIFVSVIAIITHSLYPVLIYLPMILFSAATAIYAWHCRLVLDTETEKIFFQGDYFSVYAIQSVQIVYYPRRGSTFQIELSDRTINMFGTDKNLYNLQYLLVFLKTHDIPVQEKRR